MEADRRQEAQTDQGGESRGLARLQAVTEAPKLECLPDWGQIIECRWALLVTAAVTSAQKKRQRSVKGDV